jgi:hypothetical protein
VVLTRVGAGELRCWRDKGESGMDKVGVSGTPKVIRLKDAPKAYGWVSERYLRRLVAEERIRAFHVGRRVYLAHEDILALLVETPARRSAR